MLCFARGVCGAMVLLREFDTIRPFSKVQYTNVELFMAERAMSKTLLKQPALKSIEVSFFCCEPLKGGSLCQRCFPCRSTYLLHTALSIKYHSRS